MKKSNRLVMSVALAVCLVLTIVSTVFADSDTTNVPEPTAHSNVSGLNYAYDILNPTKLPGTINDGSSAIVPEGFSGVKQFVGDGIKIFDITTTDTVTVCFAFPDYQQGWTGRVYKWYDGAWTAWHSTLVAPSGENSLYHVCSSRATNGIYALLASYSVKK